MKTNEQIYEKVERDQVMNLSELAVASGYPRSALTAMKVPLIGGKISLSDFKRILRQRQDQMRKSALGDKAGIGEQSRSALPIGSAMADNLFFGSVRS